MRYIKFKMFDNREMLLQEVMYVLELKRNLLPIKLVNDQV